MLAEMYTHCKFSKDGCAEIVRYIDKRRHEENCPCAACSCPVDGCGYRGTLLYKHVLDDHEDMVSSVAYLQSRTLSTVTLWLQKSAPFVVFVQVGAKSVLLLLNGGGVPTGRCLSLVYLGQCAEGNAEINYELEVRGSEPGTLSLVATAPCIRQLEGFEAKKFLFVPDADWGPSGVVSVTVSYW
jgi:E3 ubiquitin-protein ligase SIAH1